MVINQTHLPIDHRVLIVDNSGTQGDIYTYEGEKPREYGGSLSNPPYQPTIPVFDATLSDSVERPFLFDKRNIIISSSSNSSKRGISISDDKTLFSGCFQRTDSLAFPASDVQHAFLNEPQPNDFGTRSPLAKYLQ